MNRLSKEYTTTNNKEKVKAQYTYGKTGGVTLVTNDTSAIANKYDNKGLIMEQKLFEDGKSYAMVYGNNANGKCVYSKIYNNNTGHYGDYDIQQMINYEYDAKGNMTTVSDSLNNSKVMARYTYDSNDNLSSVTYGNGTSTSYTYNKGNNSSLRFARGAAAFFVSHKTTSLIFAGSTIETLLLFLSVSSAV